MNSKTAALVVLGIIFLLAGVFNMAFEKIKALDMSVSPSDSLSGLFSRITGFLTGATKITASEIEANLTLPTGFPQDLGNVRATSLKVMTYNRVSSIIIKPLLGSSYTVDLMPSTSVNIEGYEGKVVINDGLEIDGKALSIQATGMKLRAENSLLRVSSPPVIFSNLVLANVSIGSFELVNVKGSITLKEGKDSIIHIISQPRNIVLRSFVGDIIINGSTILIRGRASYIPEAPFSSPVNLPLK